MCDLYISLQSLIFRRNKWLHVVKHNFCLQWMIRGEIYNCCKEVIVGIVFSCSNGHCTLLSNHQLAKCKQGSEMRHLKPVWRNDLLSVIKTNVTEFDASFQGKRKLPGSSILRMLIPFHSSGIIFSYNLLSRYYILQNMNLTKPSWVLGVNLDKKNPFIEVWKNDESPCCPSLFSIHS